MEVVLKIRLLRNAPGIVRPVVGDVDGGAFRAIDEGGREEGDGVCGDDVLESRRLRAIERPVGPELGEDVVLVCGGTEDAMASMRRLLARSSRSWRIRSRAAKTLRTTSREESELGSLCSLAFLSELNPSQISWTRSSPPRKSARLRRAGSTTVASDRSEEAMCASRSSETRDIC